MDEVTESDIIQSDNKILHTNLICNHQLNTEIDTKSSVFESSPIKIYDENVGYEETEDKQLFDLMVLDDDSLNQLQITAENHKEEDSSETTTSSKELCNLQDVKLEHEITNIKKFENSEDNNQNDKPFAKAPESDSLILTADDEFETEMFLSEKGKKEKLLNDVESTLISLNSKKIEEQPITKVIRTETLILSGNDDVHPTTCKKKLPKTDAIGSRFLWVSNITNSIKATELKQFLSKIGKVITAKIVTDGKKCYGYVVMDNIQDGKECVKILNNTMFEGRKITVSFTRPARDKKESSSVNDNKENKAKFNNETVVDKKYTKSKDRIKSPSRNNRDSSKTRSNSLRKHSSRDPLTTIFKCKNQSYRKKRSSHEISSTDFLRDKLERDRLKRRILEEQRRRRDEMMREMHREEKQRELEFRLERERKKLQFERELFERERRELYRLDAERRKIEKERLEIMQERTKLEKEYQKNRSCRKNDDFNLSSTIVKPPVMLKGFEKPKPKNIGNNSNFRKIENKRDRNTTNNSKSVGSHRIGLKDDFKLGKENNERSKSRRREDLKNYDRPAPPPPTLSNDFNFSAGKKFKHQDFKRDVHSDRKIDQGERKIEVLDRKYYGNRPQDNSVRKDQTIYKKPDFDDRKSCSFAERRYDYGHDAKRTRISEFPIREPTIRNQWLSTTNYTEPWKTGINTITSNSPVRYQGGHFSRSSYSETNRISPVYYHSESSTQEYQRYDLCTENNTRKYE
ncbi:hypothetical protein FQR65_LT03292 [Abscondita terminalis]|nr:hypothetical protein FQR65_LT03292 [Abscondita terminalis]